MDEQKIDQLINELCDYIIQLKGENGPKVSEQVAQNTEALASLVLARVRLLRLST